MSMSFSGTRSALKSLRIILLIAGIIALLAGLVVVFWPEATGRFIVALIAGYLVIAGLMYLAAPVFSRELSGWSRLGHVVLGLLYIAAGVGAFVNLAMATTALGILFALFVGISWIIDGVVALSLLGDSSSRGWTLFYAIIGIVGGVVVCVTPLFALTVLLLIMGITMIALGAVQIVRAIQLGRALDRVRPPLSQDAPAIVLSEADEDTAAH